MTGGRNFVLKALPVVDRAVARCRLAASERPKLLCFLVHGLYRAGLDLGRSPALPAQLLRLDRLRAVIEYFLRNGYRLVGPEDVVDGLDPDGKYAMITFDDGYYNNVLALPVLEEFDVPAVFSIATENVERAKAFWWDAAHRQGAGFAEIAGLKRLALSAVEARLKERDGVRALVPVGDIDRPFAPAELKDFARHRLVRLGNHTLAHARLAELSRDAAGREIRGCQEALRRMTGRTPIAIAYPNGEYREETVAIARECGLEVGLTVEPRANRLPLDGSRMTLGRFAIRDDDDHGARCDLIRAEFVLSQRLAALARGPR